MSSGNFHGPYLRLQDFVAYSDRYILLTSTTHSVQALARLLRYAKGYRRRILAATACSIINKLFDIAPEILIGVAIDVVVNKEDSFVARLNFTTPEEQILVLAILTFFIWVGESLFEYLYKILWRNLAQRLQADLRQDTYEHVQQLDMSFFESKSSGHLVAIMNDDVNQLERFLDGGANALIQVGVAVIAVGAVFFILSPLIALLAFTPVPLIIWGAFFFQRKAGPLYNDVREKVGDLASRLGNNLSGIATIKSFTAEAREAERLKAVSETYVEANRRAIRVSSAFIPVIRMAILVGFLATFTIGGMMALQGSLNVGAYGVLVFLTQRLLWPLTGLAEVIDLFERAMASTRRILDLLEVTVEVQDVSNRSLATPVRGEVHFQGVSFRYASSGAGVENINLSVPGGSTLALVGATGSGKSTLIKLLLRFYDPHEGQVCIDGQPVREISLYSLRQAIGLVSQEVYLFEGSIRNNIAYGRPDADEESIIKAAITAEAWNFIHALPQGLDTPVGERGVRLSGGQRQRLSLARALIKNPPILVLDEATSAVDNETEAAIQRSLQRIGHDRTVIMIAHRLSTIVYADRIVVIHQGRVIEHGTHAELLEANGRYAAQWRVQTGLAKAEDTLLG
ncbi:ABC transporter, transmembrane region [Nitrosococcus oceani ATCC 19707]|uniref:ABC transporter, transmembrane region n=2 Tax=Nitrosococcus oceani TaxID=1229 RepID=Q3JEU8_NITOC|nr:ABC transporter ATP-binding protein [Nitrosococcus oceani]ABA56648.1 ABC transporter, transmembrane region [Nitrosococcus oceani ATCC 19707]EDZ66475.1 ABC transporter, ATP-binding protein [Nitrosococcus oceani AFC27]KFI20893.1 ABC transporter [Nitrosococcus oceani C-27]GEM20782.1 ABC transporter [Nitrosococcus oceani]